VFRKISAVLLSLAIETGFILVGFTKWQVWKALTSDSAVNLNSPAHTSEMIYLNNLFF